MSPESAQASGAPAPDGQQVHRPSSVASLVLVSVALLAGAAGTFMFLGAHPSAGTVGAPIANGAVASPAAPGLPPAAATAVGHIWSRDDEYRWIANHKRSVAYELEADQQVRVWTTHVRPSLVVRCLNHKTEVFVYTETPSKLESTDGLHSVRLTFDDGGDSEERWPDSAEHDGSHRPITCASDFRRTTPIQCRSTSISATQRRSCRTSRRRAGGNSEIGNRK
jgi:hypothetical protein